MEAIKGEYLGRPYDDIVECFSYVKTHLAFADTDRAIAMGGSYGGALINWIAGHPLGKCFKALVNHQGMLNLSALYGVDVMDMAYGFGGEFWEVRKNYDRYGTSTSELALSKQDLNRLRDMSWERTTFGDSVLHPRWVLFSLVFGETDMLTPKSLLDPGRFTQNWTTPILLIHSDLDFRCPVTEGLAAFTVLKSRGIEARFLNFEDEGHWVLKPENSFKMVEKCVRLDQ